MSDFGVARFVPGDAGEIVFGLKIFEADIPNERAESFDGIDFVALSADETKAEIFVGVFGETSFTIGGVVVAGVFEGFKTGIAQGGCASLIGRRDGTQFRGPLGAG